MSVEDQVATIADYSADGTLFARTLTDDMRVWRVARILAREDLEWQKHRQLMQMMAGGRSTISGGRRSGR